MNFFIAFPVFIPESFPVNLSRTGSRKGIHEVDQLRGVAHDSIVVELDDLLGGRFLPDSNITIPFTAFLLLDEMKL